MNPLSLTWVGVAKFRLASDGREEYGAIYQREVDAAQEFEPNDEIERVVLWDPREPRERAHGPGDTAPVQDRPPVQ